MKSALLLLTALWWAAMNWIHPTVTRGDEGPLYRNPKAPVEERIKDLLRRMTLEEKIDMLGGTGFATKPNARLGVPEFKMTDGPVGVRWGQSTAFPASVAMAASWDTELVERLGRALAREAKAKGRNVLLGPCINIQRVPHGGRNFESFSEDPFLASRMAVAYVKGVQSEKVVATPKHFACNNQEWERTTIDARVDERTLREIYLRAFNAAIQEGGAWSIMAAYNKVNGAYCSENVHLLRDILKNEWGFQGFVMSDWGAVHSTIETANAGLDLEMPEGQYLNRESLLKALQEGRVSEATIDDKITRLLRVMFVSGIFDGQDEKQGLALDEAEQRTIALEAARAGIVLLKNENSILPLELGRLKSLAVIGPNAAIARTGGGGSSQVTPTYSVSPLEGIRNKAGTRIAVSYALGCRLAGDISPIDSTLLLPPAARLGEHGLLGEYFDNKDLQGEPVLKRIDKQVFFDWADGSPAKELKPDHFSVRWTGKLIPAASGTYELGVTSDDGVRLYLDRKLIVDDWRDHAAETHTATVNLQAGVAYDLRLEYYENTGAAVAKLGWWPVETKTLSEAIEVARKSDVAVVFAGLSSHFESEGFDRESLELPEEQTELITAVASANRKTVVVLNTGAPVLMSKWIDSVPALVEAWYPGQEGGNAIADVLFGDVNPSGKLPVTFLREWKDSPAFPTYPGKEGVTQYAEGIFVGYRHFDKNDIEPLFPFGHGLSYTTFVYRDLTIKVNKGMPDPEVEVALTLENTGEREGKEVVQLYIRDIAASVERPVKELKGFQKVPLKPGEKKRVTFWLDKSALAFYDVAARQWVVEPGQFEVIIGSSSRDIRLRSLFELK